MSKDPTQLDELMTKINRETAKIAWAELQKFFAQGRALQVASGQDLVQVAKWMAEDDSAQIEALVEKGLFGRVNDDLAKKWLEDRQIVWAVVSAPWVLVQAVD